MKKITTLLFTLIFLLIIYDSFAQRPQRFRRSQPFPDELERFFELGNNKERADTLMAKFRNAWDNFRFTEDEKKYIFSAANKLLQARTRPNPFPHFENYLLALLLFEEKEHQRESWEKWHEGLIYLFEEHSRRKAEEFQEFTLLLLRKNILYESRSTTWIPSASDYTFYYNEEDKYRAAVYFENIKLHCDAFVGDSLNIYNTTGYYYPVSEEWRGKGGKVTWERARVPHDIYAKLQDYTIDMKHYYYDADTVEFYHSGYFSVPIAGSLTDRIIRPRMITDSLGNEVRDLEKVTYPRFTSFDNKVVIKNILEDIDFKGSFAMQGSKFYGRETSDAPAMLEYKRKGRVFAKISSASFAILSDKITSVDASVVFYLDKDSIFNTGMELTFDKKTNKLTISQPARIQVKSFFTNTYHALSFDTQMIVWTKDDDKLYLRSLPTVAQNIVYFESLNFFSKYRDKKIAPDNRLFAVKKAIENNSGIQSGYFTTNQVAFEMEKPIQSVRRVLLELASTGLIEFNPYSDEGHAGKRFFDYIETRAGRLDYDNIIIISELYRSTINGIIDLNNYDLTVFGVAKVPVSFRQGVDVRPANKQIVVKKGLNFEYDGELLSGAHYAVDNDAMYLLKKEPMITPGILSRMDSLRNVYYGSENQFRRAVKEKTGMEIPDEAVGIITKCAAKGLFRIIGRDFKFSYNNYNIELNKIDSATMAVGISALNARGDTVLVARPVRSTFEPKSYGQGYFKGKFYIDNKNNKSGRDFNIEFPKFEFTEPSYIFYDKRSEQYWSVQDSAFKALYPRNKFYYEIAPFELDSINYVTLNQRFPGKLVSAKIFPDIDYDLRIMDDFSLGFWYNTPKYGLDMYEGKGTFFNDIKLSNAGLESKNGELHFMTSKTKSKDFVMYIDSTKTRTTAWSFIVDKSVKQPQYPSAKSDSVSMVWHPYKDKMIIATLDTATYMYDNRTRMEGVYTLTSKKLNGDGRMTYKNGSYVSQVFDYKADIFEADSATFSVRDNKGQLALHSDRIRKAKKLKDYVEAEDLEEDNEEETDDGGGLFRKKDKNLNDSLRLKKDTTEIPRFDHVKLKVDYTTNVAEMKTRDRNVFVNFAKSTYMAFVDRFYWIMNTNTVEVGDAKEETNEEARKLSLENKQLEDVLKKGYAHMIIKKQDSLNFFSGVSVLTVDSQLITSKVVPYLDVADASIHPSQPFEIEKTAKMRTLKSAKIIANRVTQFHTIFDANIDVYGRYSYAGDGKYVYTDEDQKTQIINFYEVAVNDSMQTIAKGKIEGEQEFYLNSGFMFKGDVSLYAPRQLLIFDGMAKINHDCKTLGVDWFKTTSEVIPDSVLLDVSLKGLKKADRRYAGAFISRDSIHVYSSMMLNKKRFNDKKVFAAIDTSSVSKMYFDRNNQKYIVASESKLRNYKNPGQYFSLDLSTCNIHGKGKISFGMEFDFLDLTGVGDFYHQTISDSVKMEMMLGVDFGFNKEATSFMGKMIMQSTDSTIDVTKKKYKENLIEMLGDASQLDTLFSQLVMAGKFTTFPEALNHNIMFSDLKMVWVPETESYKSVGPIGIGNIGTKQINKYVNGFVHVMKRRTDDMIDIYIEADESTWFFFTYSRGIMATLSSLNTYNDIIFDTKEKDRTFEDKTTGKIYIYEKSSLPIRAAAIRRFENSQP